MTCDKIYEFANIDQFVIRDNQTFQTIGFFTPYFTPMVNVDCFGIQDVLSFIEEYSIPKFKIRVRLLDERLERHEKREFLTISTTSKLKSKRQTYDARNAYRNQLLPENRECKFCKFVWPKGCFKIQTFEGVQSKCNRGVKFCKDTSYAKYLSN